MPAHAGDDRAQAPLVGHGRSRWSEQLGSLQEGVELGRLEPAVSGGNEPVACPPPSRIRGQLLVLRLTSLVGLEARGHLV